MRHGDVATAAASADARQQEADGDDGPYSINASVVLRYPFRGMNMTWWDDYMRSVASADRVTTMLRVIDCLMAHTVLHEDPFMEEAVLHIHKRLPKAWPRLAAQELVNYFEVAHHVFKTICVTTKFDTLDTRSKHDLLATIEGRVQEIDRALKQPAVKIGSPASVAAAVRAVLESVQTLRRELGSRAAFVAMMGRLKTLYFSVSTRSGVVPRSGGEVAGMCETYPCREGCPCYTKLLTSHTVFVRDVERAKIIDCLMFAAVKDDDERMRGIVSELLNNHFHDFMESPELDDVGRYIHNGRLFHCRTALFDALNLVRYVTQLHSDAAQTTHDATVTFDRVVLSVVWVRSAVKDTNDFAELTNFLERTLVTAEGVYERIGKSDCMQALHLVRDCLTIAYGTLSAPEYHLAVHSRNVLAGKPASMRCGNSACPGTVRELLKCSGCNVAYYCCKNCQKEDWERHRTLCHDHEQRKQRPSSVASDYSEMRRIVPRKQR